MAIAWRVREVSEVIQAVHERRSCPTHDDTIIPVGFVKHPQPPRISSKHDQCPGKRMDVHLQPYHPCRPAMVQHSRAVVDGGEEEGQGEGPAGCEEDEGKLTDTQERTSISDVPQHLISNSMLAVVADEKQGSEY